MNLSSHKEVVNIADYGKVVLTIKNNIHQINELFLMAVRKNNKKRNFLFVSKLLAKHIPIAPQTLFNACRELTTQYKEQHQLSNDLNGRIVCTQKTLVIGFAETATAMGHAVYDCLSGDVQYVHTTRDKQDNSAFAFEFQEEHCHATEQLFFLQKEEWIKDARDIIIVDDEITTGKTIRNIINQIESYYPGKTYHIFTFLDWRNNENIEAYKNYCQSQQVNIQCYSLVNGSIEQVDINDNSVEESDIIKPKNYQANEQGWQFHYCTHIQPVTSSARQGMDCSQRSSMEQFIESIVQQITPKLKGQKRSVVGTGEFMYIPMRCAELLSGSNLCNATTRSPIIPKNSENYGVKRALQFIAPHDPNRTEYLYNINIDDCDEIILFIETVIPKEQLSSLLMALDTAGYQYKHVVFCKEK